MPHPSSIRATPLSIGAWWNAGGSRRFPRLTTWDEWIDRHAVPAFEMGVRRFWLHNPFGQWDGPMTYDQGAQSLDAGINDVELFASSWSPMLEHGAELVVYIGANNVPPPGPRLEQARRWSYGFGEHVVGRVVMVMDALSAQPGEDPEGLANRELEWYRERGFQVGMEAMPKRQHPHHLGNDVAMTWRFFKSRTDRGAFRGHLFSPAEIIEAGGTVRIACAAHQYPSRGRVHEIRSELTPIAAVAREGAVAYIKPTRHADETNARLRALHVHYRRSATPLASYRQPDADDPARPQNPPIDEKPTPRKPQHAEPDDPAPAPARGRPIKVLPRERDTKEPPEPRTKPEPGSAPGRGERPS